MSQVDLFSIKPKMNYYVLSNGFKLPNKAHYSTFTSDNTKTEQNGVVACKNIIF